MTSYNPFAAKPKWQTSSGEKHHHRNHVDHVEHVEPQQWGEFPPLVGTPLPTANVPKYTQGNNRNNEMLANNNNGSNRNGSTNDKNLATTKKAAWRGYLVPILIVVLSLIAIVVIAVVIFLVRHRQKKRSERVPHQFTPASDVLEDDEDSHAKIEEIPDTPKNAAPKQPVEALPVPAPDLTTSQLMALYEQKHSQQASPANTQTTRTKPPPSEKKKQDKKQEVEEGPPLESPLPRISYTNNNNNQQKKNRTEDVRTSAAYLAAVEREKHSLPEEEPVQELEHDDNIIGDEENNYRNDCSSHL